ncbi:MAG: hypothetical protein ASARMPRED_000553 [Alectoria sarmentosa]|nr:MAG: hypothetical protein ASARMPRED_000553 [Alectoria sarmentosa]
MPTHPGKVALAAQAMPPPPPPDKNTPRFSKLKPFGLKMFVKYMPTGVVRGSSEKGEETMGVQIQAWAEGESKQSIAAATACYLEQRLDADEYCVVGLCAIEIKSWHTEYGNSFETSIEQLRGLTDDKLLNQQLPLMAGAEVQQASAMRNLEDADLVGEFSALKPFGQDSFFRVLDILEAGRILETEVEVLGLRSEVPPDAHASVDQYRIVGKAIISTSISRHWEATIELMQANTNDRFVNIQIFAGLLRCIRRICNERLIGHLTIVDIEDTSQSWYRYFFKLAGFSQCHCQDSAGSTLQLENRVCLAWRESSQQDISTAYKMVRIWLAEGRCTSSLLDSVASGEAAEVERKYFRDLLAEMWEEKPSQREQAHTERIARGQMYSHRPWQEPVTMSTAPRRKAKKPGSESLSLRKHWFSQDVAVKSMGSSALRAMTTMSTILEQSPREHGPMFESLGPYFFSQIYKKEAGGSGSDAPDAAPYEEFYIELSATGLGFLDARNAQEDQRTKIGSATLSIIEARFHDSEDLYKSCKIERLDVETGNTLTNMEAFAAMLRRIQSFCIEYQAEHLAMAPMQGSCWFSGLLKSAGFSLCGCELLQKHVGAGFQLCMVLPTPPIELPARLNEDSLMDDLAVGQSDEAVAATEDDLAREMSSIRDQYNRLMKKVQKQETILDFKQMPAEGQGSSNTCTLIRPIDEVRRTQCSSGSVILAPISNGRLLASLSAGPTWTARPRGSMTKQTGPITLAKNSANSAIAAKKGEDPLLMAVLRSNAVQECKEPKKSGVDSSTSDSPLFKPANMPTTKPSNKDGRRCEQEPGAISEDRLLGKPSLFQHQEIGASPAASQVATDPKELRPDSPQLGVRGHSRGSPFEGNALIDSFKNKAPAPSNIPENTQPAAKIVETPGPLPKKVYCMYWLRKGECDYMQEGCRYKHEMPIDEETRLNIGIREIPWWFTVSPEYESFLQQVPKSATGGLTDVRSNEEHKFTSQPSGQGSGRRDSDVSLHRGGGVATTKRDPVKIGSFVVHFPHENHHYSTIASNTEAKTHRARPPKIDSTKAVNKSRDRRFEREIYRPPRAIVSFRGSDMGVAIKGQAKNCVGSRISPRSTRSGPSNGALSSSRSALDSASSILPGRMKRRPSSPVSDADDHRAKPRLKRAKTRESTNQAGN